MGTFLKTVCKIVVSLLDGVGCGSILKVCVHQVCFN